MSGDMRFFKELWIILAAIFFCIVGIVWITDELDYYDKPEKWNDQQEYARVYEQDKPGHVFAYIATQWWEIDTNPDSLTEGWYKTTAPSNAHPMIYPIGSSHRFSLVRVKDNHPDGAEILEQTDDFRGTIDIAPFPFD